jgi:hypothetical protein
MRQQKLAVDDGSGLAQSEVIGVVLILGITFTGISIILVTGNPTLEDTKELARTSTAENGISLLDERVSSAALSGAEKKRFRLNLQSGKLSVSPEDGKMRIYSSPGANVWSRSPGASNAVHVMNFTIESDSEIASNETYVSELEEITVRYPSGFDVSGTDGDYGVEGIDSDIDGTVDTTLSEDDTDTSGSTELTVEFNGGILNETDRITMEYDDIDQPPGAGEYDVNVTVQNTDGKAVTKEMVVELGEDVEPPVRQIDTTVQMGKLEYETSDSVIAYQNGGVWTKSKGEETISRTVSKPEVYYDGNTLTASIINITNTADISLGGTPSMTATNTRNERVFPVKGTERTNPLGDTLVYLEVNTSYHEGWSNYFERETVGDVVEVEGTGDSRTVSVELSPLPDTVYNQAILARNGNLTIANTTVDSYDSGVSDYSERFRFANADVAAGGNVSLENETGSSLRLSRVYGDVLSNDSVVMENRTLVNGSVKAHGYPGAPGGENITLEGTGCRVQDQLVAPGSPGISAPDCPSGDNGVEINREPSETLPDVELVDDEIQQRIDEYGTTFPGSPTVSSGNYIVDSDTSLFSDITFDTTRGPINIAVNSSDQLLFTGLEIEVNGTNPVRIYSGNSTSGVFPKIEFDNVEMDVEDNRTDLFTLFVESTRPSHVTNVTIQDSTDFYGTLYAPDTDEVQVTESRVHGAMVVGEADIVNSGVHYDQQLRDPAAEGSSAVNYLHVTDNRVRIR